MCHGLSIKHDAANSFHLIKEPDPAKDVESTVLAEIDNSSANFIETVVSTVRDLVEKVGD